MTVRWGVPDDPSWLTVEPDIRPVDLQVLRQAGVPESLLFLAVREEGATRTPPYRWGAVGACRRFADLSFLDDPEDCDPDPLACYDRDYRRF